MTLRQSECVVCIAEQRKACAGRDEFSGWDIAVTHIVLGPQFQATSMSELLGISADGPIRFRGFQQPASE
jgi:hypothetical protein